MFYIGIDIGKRSHVASIMNDEGKVVLKGFSFPNTIEGGEKLLGKIHDFSSFLNMLFPKNVFYKKLNLSINFLRK